MGYSFSFNSDLLIHITLQSHAAALRQGLSAGGVQGSLFFLPFFEEREGTTQGLALSPPNNLFCFFPFPSLKP